MVRAKARARKVGHQNFFTCACGIISVVAVQLCRGRPCLHCCHPLSAASLAAREMNRLSWSKRVLSGALCASVGSPVRVAEPLLSGDSAPVQLKCGDLGTITHFDNDDDMYVYFPHLAKTGTKGPKFEAIVFRADFTKLEQMKVNSAW